MDGLLEDPKPHETAPIPADFPGVEFDADLNEEVATPQKVAGDNSAAAAVSANAGILHGTPTADDDEAEDDDIKEVDMPQNEPTELINVDAGSNEEQNQEDQDESPVDTLSQSQENVSNTTDMPGITAFNDRTAGDNPNGTVEM